MMTNQMVLDSLQQFMGRGFDTAQPVVKPISTGHDAVEHAAPATVMPASWTVSAGLVSGCKGFLRQLLQDSNDSCGSRKTLILYLNQVWTDTPHILSKVTAASSDVATASMELAKVRSTFALLSGFGEYVVGDKVLVKADNAITQEGVLVQPSGALQPALVLVGKTLVKVTDDRLEHSKSATERWSDLGMLFSASMIVCCVPFNLYKSMHLTRYLLLLAGLDSDSIDSLIGAIRAIMRAQHTRRLPLTTPSPTTLLLMQLNAAAMSVLHALLHINLVDKCTILAPALVASIRYEHARTESIQVPLRVHRMGM